MSFQRHLVRSSTLFYQRFNLLMGRSPGFGSAPRNLRPIKTCFRYGSVSLTWLLNATRRSVLQKVRHYSHVELWLIVSMRFQVLFHSSSEVLFTFPSRYWFTIGRRGVFSLGGWAPRLPTRFLVPRGTPDTLRIFCLFAYRALTFYGWLSQVILLKRYIFMSVLTPIARFGLFPLRSPLLGESSFLSLPPGT